MFSKTNKMLRWSAILVLMGCSMASAAIPDSVRDAVEARVLSESTEPCVDTHSIKTQCVEWAWFGECEKNKGFMHDQCRQSCGLCTPTEEEKGPCQDYLDTCEKWSLEGNDKVDNLCHGHWNSIKDGHVITGAYVIEMCPKSCNACDIHLDDRDINLGIGLPQSYKGMETDKELFNLLRSKVSEIRDYVNSITDQGIRDVCKMSHPNCARFALSSDCDANFDHPIMKYGCAAACKTCDKLASDTDISEARNMWGYALREFNEQRSTQETIGAKGVEEETKA